MAPTCHLETTGATPESQTLSLLQEPGQGTCTVPGKEGHPGPFLPLGRWGSDGMSLRSLHILQPWASPGADLGPRRLPWTRKPFPTGKQLGVGDCPLARTPVALCPRPVFPYNVWLADWVGLVFIDSPQLSAQRGQALFLSTWAHVNNGFSYSCRPNRRGKW